MKPGLKPGGPKPGPKPGGPKPGGPKPGPALTPGLAQPGKTYCVITEVWTSYVKIIVSFILSIDVMIVVFVAFLGDGNFLKNTNY